MIVNPTVRECTIQEVKPGIINEKDQNPAQGKISRKYAVSMMPTPVLIKRI